MPPIFQLKELISKFVDLERKLSQEKGDFILFALFLREDAPDRWDLVVAAHWIEAERKTAIAFIAHEIQLAFEPEELKSLSRIVRVDETNPALAAITTAVKAEHSVVDVENSNFFGLQIKHAYIITSRKPAVPAEVLAT